MKKTRGWLVGVVVAGSLTIAGVGWWWFVPPLPSQISLPVKIVHAAGGVSTGCASCHVTPVASPDCTSCHASPSTVITPARVNFTKHHRASSEKWYQNCQNAGCHAGVSGDVRYAVLPVLSSQEAGHSYCFNTCHKSEDVKPSCNNCHKNGDD